VGYSYGGGDPYATEWTGGSIVNLGVGEAFGINDAGQEVGYGVCAVVGGYTGCAAEFSGGSTINLGGSIAYGINDAGQAAGVSNFVPEPSTWALMLLGFAGLSFAGYRRARAGGERLAA
jgi:hypothetical protein